MTTNWHRLHTRWSIGSSQHPAILKNLEQSKTTREHPGFIKVVFDYPFHLGLPRAYFPVRIKEEDVFGLIKIEPREGVQVYDKKKVLREDKIEGKKQIILQDIQDPDNTTMEMVGTGENGYPLFHYVAGRSGRASYPWHYCQVEVIFPVNDVYSAWLTPKNSDFIGVTTAKLFNKLLVHYRNVSNDVLNKLQAEDNDLSFYTTLYISEFSSEEKRQSTIVLLQPNKVKKRTFVPFPMQGSVASKNSVPLVKASIAAPLMTNTQKKEMEPEKIVAFIQGSGGIYDVKIFNQILLAGLERIVMDKDYRIAITEFDTAVEMAVMYYLIIFLIKGGKNNEEINDLFDETLQTSRDMGPNGYLSTRNRMTRLSEFFGNYRLAKSLKSIDIFDTDEYRNWIKDVRKKRNESVHMWEHFKKPDAEAAFYAAQKYIRFIQKIGDELV